MRRIRSLHAALALSLAALVAGTACAPGSGLRSRAESVLSERARENPEYLKYALANAESTAHPFVRAMVVEAIGSDNFQIAIQALRALGSAPPAEALDAARAVFANKRGALKLQAASVLARGGDADALEFVRQQLADRVQPLRIESVLAVAAQPDGEAFLTPILRERIGREALADRNEAYAVLGELRAPWATRLLLEGLEKEHGEERQQAIAALGRTGDPAVAVEIARFVNTQGLVFATIEALGRLGDPKQQGAVRAMLGNDEPAVRAYASVALWQLGDEAAALQTLDPLLDAPDSVVRRIVAERLEAVETPGAHERLQRLGRDADKDVRVAALRSLGAHATAGDLAFLQETAADPAYEVSTLALNLLARVGTSESLASLGPRLDDPNAWIALSAANAILAIEGRAGG